MKKDLQNRLDRNRQRQLTISDVETCLSYLRALIQVTSITTQLMSIIDSGTCSGVMGVQEPIT